MAVRRTWDPLFLFSSATLVHFTADARCCPLNQPLRPPTLHPTITQYYPTSTNYWPASPAISITFEQWVRMVYPQPTLAGPNQTKHDRDSGPQLERTQCADQIRFRQRSHLPEPEDLHRRGAVADRHAAPDRACAGIPL